MYERGIIMELFAKELEWIEKAIAEIDSDEMIAESDRIIDAESMEKITASMPESFRQLHESGEVIRIRIMRREPLKRYGDEITVRIWRDLLIDSDLEEYEETWNICKNILSYFLYGERGKLILRNFGNGYRKLPTEDFAIEFSM